MRAVIFDLWDTLALWPSEAFEQVKRSLGRHIDDVDHVWTTTYRDRQIGSMESYFRGLGLDDDAVADACASVRHSRARRSYRGTARSRRSTSCSGAASSAA
jgi:hypothetical protein